MNENEKIIEKIFNQAAITNHTLHQRLYVTWINFSNITEKDVSISYIRSVIDKLNLNDNFNLIKKSN